MKWVELPVKKKERILDDPFIACGVDVCGQDGCDNCGVDFCSTDTCKPEKK